METDKHTVFCPFYRANSKNWSDSVLNMKKKFALGVLSTLLLLIATVSSASAAKIVVQNTFERVISIAVVYFDTGTRLWTTRG